MPRGYLKHKQKEVGRKRARGGSSKKDMPKDPRSRSKRHENKSARFRSSEVDLDIASPSIKSSNREENRLNNASTNYPVSECPICFEQAPLIPLSSKCKWHEPACYKCLQRLYVTEAQKDTKNYPLCCYHPQCRQPVQLAQLEKHNIICTLAEIQNHHDMVLLSKIQKIDGIRVVCCPFCSIQRFVPRKMVKDKKCTCKKCRKCYRVTPDCVAIRSLVKDSTDNRKYDRFGGYNGVARCPGCSILICKGGGCDHMRCPYCSRDFSWSKGVADFGAVAFPPDEELYKWW